MPFIAGVRAVGFTQSKRRYPAFIENLDALVGASFVRRDGTLNLTGTWDVGGQEINNVSQLGVGTATPGDIFHVATVAESSTLRVDASGEVLIGTSGLGSKLLVKQGNPTGAKPVLLLNQADVSEEFTHFIGESAADASQSLVDAADLTTPGAIVGWTRIFIEDIQSVGPIADGIYFVPFYAAPTV